MKQLFTLAASFVFCASLHAQVTIGQNEMPHSGDHLFSTKATLNPFLNYGATGAAHTWNFSSLSAAGQESTNYVSVSSTNLVYALVYADIFFNPNRANLANSGTDIAFSDLLPIGNPYTFHRQSATAYETVGYGAEIANIPLPIIFDEHDMVYELPMHFGDNTTSISSWKVDLPSLAYYGYRQTRQNQVDGWGSITTPSGTYDALRVKTTITAKDTINLDTLGLGFAINRPVTRQYKWLSPGIRVPVLEIRTVEILGAEVATDIYFYDLPRSISVQEPLAAMLCMGAPVSVPYTRTGTYNSGSLFVPANVFRAQLSDANGDFTNAVNIGSMTSTAAGSINTTIPANTPAGSGYRIRVVSTSPAFTGADNGYDLTIGTVPVALASADGPTTFCAGGTVELLAQAGPGLSFQWLVDGDTLTDATTTAWDASATGSYSVLVSNTCGSDVSAPMDVVVDPLPVHMPDTTGMVACNAEAVLLTTTNTSGQTVLEYQWLLNGVPMAEANSADLSTTAAGEYTLESTNLTTGCSFTTAAITVMTGSVASPVLSANGPTAFCGGGTVQLATDAQGVSVQWLLDGADIVGATGENMDATVGGSYTAIATGDLGCISQPSDAITVDMLPVPETPSINASSAISFCEGGMVTLTAGAEDDVSFLWNTGSTENQLSVTTSGSYTVVATSDNGCSSASSEAVEVTVEPLPELPVITEMDGVLEATGSGSFQWSYNGEGITDADQSELTPNASGVYTVTVTNDNGCSTTSEEYAFIHTAVARHTEVEASVWPNPTTGAFTITLPGAQANEHFSIFDATGKLVRTGSLNGIRTSVEMTDRTPGLYLLHVLSQGSNSVIRIVLN